MASLELIEKEKEKWEKCIWCNEPIPPKTTELFWVKWKNYIMTHEKLPFCSKKHLIYWLVS